jgi:Nucleotidyl transferase AbiEii toxin, Type IV TA system
VTSFGGTALHRCHFPAPDAGGRLSEDIDLCALERRQVAEALDGELPRLLRREFPGCTWNPGLAGALDALAARWEARSPK